MLTTASVLLSAVAADNVGSAGGRAMASEQELIVLAAPRAADPYYARDADRIFDFHIAFARAVEGRDRMLILTDETNYSRYAAELGSARVAVAPVDDIWMRDFGPVDAASPMMFRYTAAGQGDGRRGQADADAVQDGLASILGDAGVRFGQSDLLNDGGNFVDDGAGRAVVSRKFLRDNGLSEAAGRVALRQEADVDDVAFIEADEQGGLEHADGVVAFIGPNTLAINSYPDDPAYARRLRANLEAGLPGVAIHEIVTPYDGSFIRDARFGSACGLYTNMLVTPERIYLPQFGIAEDAEALAALRSWTDKEVIPVSSHQVCHLGGGVRCMSWQTRGPEAERLLEWAHGIDQVR